MTDNKIWYIVIRQPLGEEEYWDFSTMRGAAAYARDAAVWQEGHTLDRAYWDANPKTAVAKVQIVEIERFEW